ncbi:terminase family protein [Patescibacteria group bacterium]|nr:terminase family protein [Patescibacteria group bacterium]
MLSPAQLLASLSDSDRAEQLKKLSTEELANLRWNWKFWARPNQLVPEGDWSTWLILAGRGFGKTRTGAETIRDWVCGPTPMSAGRYNRIALVAETAPDARDVMVEGESGLLAVHPKDFRPVYEPSKRRVTWPNGAVATLYNAVEPDQLRGPQHDAAWCDELAKWRYCADTWDQLAFGLRLGEKPRAIITTTPRPLPLLRKMLNDPTVFVTRGSTFDNTPNLASNFIRTIEDKYGGTRLGRQELEGEMLEDIPGALWNRTMIDGNRLHTPPEDLERVLVAIDPSTTSEEGSDETGIVVVGLARDNDGYARGYVLEDGSLRGTPEEWARKAVQLYRKWSADKIVAEKNQGGEMVSAVIKAVDRSVPITLVHASRGKIIRAEPISALYEQNRIHHCGRFDKLEDQMCIFSIDNIRSNGFGSPDRVDALVWGLTEIFDKITARRRKPSGEVSNLPEVKQSYRAAEIRKSTPNSWMAG